MRGIKKRSIPWRSLQLLLWVGPALVIAGLSSGFVAGVWGPMPLALLVSGAVICGLWLAILSSKNQSFWGQRSTQAGSNALIATLSVVLMLGLINFVAVRYDQRFDLSENQLFTLSPQTREVIRELKQPVKVWVFAPQIRPADRELLQNLQRQNSSKFSFELVDPQAQPGLAQSFGVKSFGDVYLESGERRQLLQSLSQGDRLSESKLANTLAQLSSGKQTQVYFLQGHGERPLEAGRGGFSQALQALGDKNYLAKPLNLAQVGQVPADADTLIVAGPKRALFAGEVKALDAFLERGGSLLLMLDPNIDPGLDDLLKKWGIKLDNSLAIDASGSGQLVGLGPAVPLVTTYGDSPITQGFGNGLSFYPLARPLEVTPMPNIQFTPFLLTSPQSWAETDLKNPNLQFNAEQGDRKGPLTLGVALSRKISTSKPTPSPSPQASPSPTPSPSAEKEARLVVIGNSEFAANGAFEQQLNGDVFLNTVAWLSQKEGAALSIRPREVTNRRLTITPGQSRMLSLVSIGLLPLLAFSTATWLWWQRR